VQAKSTIRELGEDLQDDLVLKLLDKPSRDLWGFFDQAKKNAQDELILGSLIKDLDKLMEENMNMKKSAVPEEKTETVQCANCLGLVEGKTLTCMTCGMEDLGPCCIAVDDHPCEDAEEEEG
jgi:hypothetical protein